MQKKVCFFLLLNVNDYQLSSLQVVGDNSAIIMGPVLSVYLCNFLYKMKKKHKKQKVWFLYAGLNQPTLHDIQVNNELLVFET